MSIKTKIKNNLMSPNELYYLKHRTAPILHKTILLEGTHGREISGHIFALAKQLKSDFPDYQIYIAKRGKSDVNPIFTENIVEHMSKEYLRLLATCEFLVNDTSFWSFFHKRPEQQYFIFWHGTPLKHLGKATHTQGYGNVQRNLAAADQIFVSNQFTKEKLIDDFGIKDIVANQIVVAPSPRNSSLFEEHVQPGRYLYMPTWRGVDVAKVGLSEQMLTELDCLDNLLTEEEEVYVKLHPFEAKLLDFEEKNYQHLKPYPDEVELYQFLQTVETLITDYSSIMFDFAVTNRAIVLFTFDEKQYQAERGMYLALEDLDFPKVQTAQALVEELRKNRKGNYPRIQETFTALDNAEGTSQVLAYLLHNQQHPKIMAYDNWNQKENVLVSLTNLAENQQDSFFKWLESLDTNQKNYIFTWKDETLAPDLAHKIKESAKNTNSFLQVGKRQALIVETLQTAFYVKEWPNNPERIRRLFKREFGRLFPQMPLTQFIDYSGNDEWVAVWVCFLKRARIKTKIFVHNELVTIPKSKILFRALREADELVCTKRVAKSVKQWIPTATIVESENGDS